MGNLFGSAGGCSLPGIERSYDRRDAKERTRAASFRATSHPTRRNPDRSSQVQPVWRTRRPTCSHLRAAIGLPPDGKRRTEAWFHVTHRVVSTRLRVPNRSQNRRIHRELALGQTGNGVLLLMAVENRRVSNAHGFTR